MYAVGDVMGGLKQLLEDRVGRIWVVGELSNLSRPRSGHVYFTLKDDRGQLRAALFQSAARRLSFELEEGMEVAAYGDVSVYEARGDLQVIVRQLEPRGAGALQVAFERLRQKLANEGLFADERKRELPWLPRRVAVVTSPSGAALRDVLSVSERRLPGLPMLVVPTRVQGLGAEHEIAEALGQVSTREGVDVVLLVRGGGSIEDLQAFNTEVVARAVAACPIPVVCGVGHETDVTIADAVADVRAATPSAAAEHAVPARGELAAELSARFENLSWTMHERIRRDREAIAQRELALQREAPVTRLAAQRARVSDLVARLSAASLARVVNRRSRIDRARGTLALESPQRRIGVTRARVAAAAQAIEHEAMNRIVAAKHRFREATARLDSLSPLAVLGRGYALVQRDASGEVVRRAATVREGEALRVRLGQGALDVSVRRRFVPADDS